jgi:A/G-specific adenine glycosylase
MHRDPYHIWLSEIMLQQTLIAVVAPRFLDVVAEYPTVDAMAEASDEDVRRVFRGLGYYRRFRFFHQACKDLRGQALPRTYEQWLGVPGVGPYVAAAVSSITANEPRAVLDGNVERVLCRLRGLSIVPNLPASKKVLKAHADGLLNHEDPGAHNQAMMELGQRICTPTSPRCGECPVANHCESYRHGTQDQCPLPKARVEPKDVRLAMVIVQRRDGKIGLMQRSDRAHFLAEQAGFPTYVQVEGAWQPDRTKLVLTDRPAVSGRRIPEDRPEQKGPSGFGKLSYVGKARHSITHHRIDLSVWCGKKTRTTDEAMIWLAPKDVEQSLVANLDRKAWRLFCASSALV